MGYEASGKHGVKVLKGILHDFYKCPTCNDQDLDKGVAGRDERCASRVKENIAHKTGKRVKKRLGKQ